MPRVPDQTPWQLEEEGRSALPWFLRLFLRTAAYQSTGSKSVHDGNDVLDYCDIALLTTNRPAKKR